MWPLIVEIWEESLEPTFKELVKFFENTLAPAIKVLWDFFVLAWESMDATVIAILKTLAIVVEGLIDAVFSVIRIALELLQGDWQGAWDEVKRMFSEVWESMLRIFEAWKTPFSEAWDNVFSIVEGAIDDIVAYIATLPGKIVEAIKDIPGKFGEVFSDSFDKVKGWIARGSMVEYIKTMPGLIDDAISGIPDVFGETFEGSLRSRSSGLRHAMTAGVVASAQAAIERPGRHRGWW